MFVVTDISFHSLKALIQESPLMKALYFYIFSLNILASYLRFLYVKNILNLFKTKNCEDKHCQKS